MYFTTLINVSLSCKISLARIKFVNWAVYTLTTTRHRNAYDTSIDWRKNFKISIYEDRPCQSIYSTFVYSFTNASAFWNMYCGNIPTENFDRLYRLIAHEKNVIMTASASGVKRTSVHRPSVNGWKIPQIVGDFVRCSVMIPYAVGWYGYDNAFPVCPAVVANASVNSPMAASHSPVASAPITSDLVG